MIRNLPALYDSKPNDPSARRIGSYIMWVAIAATCVTSSMFLTALAPNLLAVELVNKTAKVGLTWTQWFLAFAPVGIALLILIPLITYWIYPPEVKQGDEVPAWAAQELKKMGGLSNREMILAGLVILALALWIFGGNFINATTVALVVISLMLVLGVVTWDDVVKHSAAWNTLAWFATLVALAEGLNRVGFVKWFAEAIAGQMGGLSPFVAMIGLVIVFYVTHYLFASITAHVTAMLPVMLARRHGDPRHGHAAVRAAALPHPRHHGHPDALRDRPEPGVLRLRLPAVEGLLAARGDLRRAVHRRHARSRAALARDHRLTQTPQP